MTISPPPELSVELIHPCRYNKRRFLANDADDPGLQELAASIQRDGVLEPVLVRVHPDILGAYELAAGERRLRASKLAKRTTVPCVLREMDDDTLFRICVVENAQRRDLHPLDQAASYQAALERGWTLEQCAAEFGIGARFIARRAQLLNLSQKWQAVISDPKHPYREWPVSHLEILARLPHEMQDQLLSTQYDWRYAVPSVANLRQVCAKQTRLLDVAPWSLKDDVLYPKAGACATCIHRSDTQPELFDQEDVSAAAGRQKVKTGVLCLSPACWAEKQERFTQREKLELQKKHANLVLVGGHNTKDAVPIHDLRRCKKSEPGAVPCLAVDDTYEARKGEFFWGKVTGGAQAQRKVAKAAGLPSATPLKERREKLNATRNRMVIDWIIEKIDQFTSEEKDFDFFLIDGRIALVAAFGTPQHKRYSHDNPWKIFERARENPGITSWALLTQALEVVKWRLSDDAGRQQPDMKDAKQVCDLFGFDLKELRQRAVLEKPEPKSWAGLNEDGTPKPASTVQKAPSTAASPSRREEGVDKRVGTSWESHPDVDPSGEFSADVCEIFDFQFKGKPDATLMVACPSQLSIRPQPHDWRFSLNYGKVLEDELFYPAIDSFEYRSFNELVDAAQKELISYYDAGDGSRLEKALVKWCGRLKKTGGFCHECGCTQDNACEDLAGPCAWADDSHTLCTACVPVDAAMKEVV